MLQLGAVVRQHSKGDIIDLGTSKVCMCQLGTRCDEFLDATAAEHITPSNINMSELGTVLCYEVDAPASFFLLQTPGPHQNSLDERICFSSLLVHSPGTGCSG